MALSPERSYQDSKGQLRRCKQQKHQKEQGRVCAVEEGEAADEGR